MRIAIITPWFTESISGGAERFAGGIATCLKDSGCEVEILTTCGKDSFWDWGKNYYEPGISEINGLKVRRFALRKRNKNKYEEVLGKLLKKENLSYTEEMQMFHETVNSDELYDFIVDNRNDYIYFFIPYIFGTSYWGSRLVPERTFIIPCLHDEEMAYLKSVGHMLLRAEGLLFNTPEEQQLAHRIHHINLADSVISGGGVEVTYKPNNNTFREKYNLSEEYFIYVGRIVGGKNVPQIIDYFNEYYRKRPSLPKLLIVGKGEEQIIEAINQSPGIIHMGELNDEDKFDAIAGSIALLQPSLMESFSIVIMESWLCGTPVIVNEYCTVTKGHCDRSRGGLYYRDLHSFEEALDQLMTSKEAASLMGAKGKKYVETEYTWSKTAQRILDFLSIKGIKKEDLLA